VLASDDEFEACTEGCVPLDDAAIAYDDVEHMETIDQSQQRVHVDQVHRILEAVHKDGRVQLLVKLHGAHEAVSCPLYCVLFLAVALQCNPWSSCILPGAYS
jgi:cytochrome b involved in lipid metabolism